MQRLTLETKKSVLSFFLNTAVKRLVEENKITKTEVKNPCYACIKAYIDSRVS
jgi:hypothetical protein